ncbi:MAG: hypothetical protein ACREBB_06565 [Nitrosotalea sp.]
MTEDQKMLTSEEMWKRIGDILIPLGTMPDKASMDYKQLQELYTSIVAADMTFRDLVQIAILKKETAEIQTKN